MQLRVEVAFYWCRDGITVARGMQLRVECSFLLVQRWNHGGKRHAVKSGV